MQIKVEQVGQGNEVLYFADFIVLESQHLQLLLALQQRNMNQLQPIEVQLLHIGVSLNRPTIADPHIGYLGQFCENDVACFFYFLEFAMFEEIPKPLIFLVESDIMKILIINEFLFGVN